ncbi:hypothetical protein WG66_010311, partial [Moniliophthora roreri]
DFPTLASCLRVPVGSCGHSLAIAPFFSITSSFIHPVYSHCDNTRHGLRMSSRRIRKGIVRRDWSIHGSSTMDDLIHYAGYDRVKATTVLPCANLWIPLMP